MTHYETLGVDCSATADDIKKAYRKLASIHHPDKGGDTATFQSIQVAYDTLSDAAKRAEYDNPTNQSRQSTSHEDMMSDLFRSFGFAFTNTPIRNKDLQITIQVSLADTLELQKKTVSVMTQRSIRHNVEIVMPRGIQNNTKIKYSGLGDNLHTDLQPGDLYVNIVVLDNPEFRVHGIDLHTNIVVNCIDAMLGTKVEIVTLDNRTLSVVIPPGSQPNSKSKIPNYGLYQLNSNTRGNLYANLSISVPQHLTSQQISLLNQVRALSL